MNPWVFVKKLSEEEIDHHLRAAQEASKNIGEMALECADKKTEVSLPKLPPSIGETEVNIDDDADYKEVIFNQTNNKVPVKDLEEDEKSDYNQDESNGVNEEPIRIKISLTNFKKRSRSSSPASSNGSSDQSSKTENLEAKRSRQSSSSVSPILSNRHILSTRFETNEKSSTAELKEPNGNTTEDESMKTIDPVLENIDHKKVQNLQKKLGPIDEESLHSGRRSRRRVGPASKQK